MKVLFVLSYLNSASWGMYFNEGVAVLSADIKKHGHQSDLFLVDDRKDISKLINYIKKTNPEIIGFSTTAVQYEGIKKIAKIIKERFPKITIVVGGVHCILSPREVIRYKYFDAICVGEGETVFADYLDKLRQKKADFSKIPNMWIKKGDKTYFNRADHAVLINKMPEPDREIFAKKDLDSYEGDIWLKPNQKGGPFLLNRGCLHNCAYCSSPNIRRKFKSRGLKYFRLLDPKKAISRVAKAVKKYNYEYVTFVDDTFSLDKKWMFSFLKLYKKRVGIPFNVQTRVDNINEKGIAALKEAGCYLINYGVESGDEIIRKKVLNKHISDDQIHRAISLTKKYKIKVNTYNMMGLPHETAKSFKKTVQINAELDVNYPFIFIFFPYPGTKLYQLCKKEKLIDYQLDDNFIGRETATLNLKKFPREDIMYYFRNFYKLIDLIKLEKKSINVFKKMWFKLKFELAFIPPSSRFFPIARALLGS